MHTEGCPRANAASVRSLAPGPFADLFPIITFLDLHGITDDEGKRRYLDGIDYCSSGDHTVMADVCSGFNDAMGPDEDIVFDHYWLSVDLLSDSEAPLMAICTIDTHEGCDVAVVTDRHRSFFGIYNGEKSYVDIFSNCRFAPNPHERVKRVWLKINKIEEFPFCFFVHCQHPIAIVTQHPHILRRQRAVTIHFD